MVDKNTTIERSQSKRTLSSRSMGNSRRFERSGKAPARHGTAPHVKIEEKYHYCIFARQRGIRRTVPYEATGTWPIFMSKGEDWTNSEGQQHTRPCSTPKQPLSKNEHIIQYIGQKLKGGERGRGREGDAVRASKVTIDNGLALI